MMIFNSTTETDLIRQRNYLQYQKQVGQTNLKVFSSDLAFCEYVKKLNLKELLGIKSPKNFPCLFHNDIHPSANIFHGSSKHSLYCCHSSRCNINTKNFFGIVSAILNLSYKEAVAEVKKFLNCQVTVDTEREELIKKVLKENQSFLNSNLEKHSALCKVLGKDILLLNLLYSIEYRSAYITPSREVVGSVSTRYIEKQLGKSAKISSKLALLSYLGFLDKLSLNELLDTSLRNLEKLRKDNPEYNYISHIRIYPLNEGRLKAAEDAAKSWKAKGYTKRAFTYKSVARESIFLANRLFPQHRI